MGKIETQPNLPDHLPVFPLPGVLLLPQGDLPLNIFEPRYLAMVDDALTTNRMIGIIQPRKNRHDAPPEDNTDPVPLYDIGCAGRITKFEETPDKRYEISLTGVCRFKIKKEREIKNGYRSVTPDWQEFIDDTVAHKCPDLDRDVLKNMLEKYFNSNDLCCDWSLIDGIGDGKLVNCLSMICPFTPEEKQVLLEAENCHARAKKLMTMLEMALHCRGEGKKDCH